MTNLHFNQSNSGSFLFFFVLILNLQPIFILPLPPTLLPVPVALLDIVATHTPLTMALSYRFANFYPLTLLLKNFVGASDFVFGVEGRERYYFTIKYKNLSLIIKRKVQREKLKVTCMNMSLYAFMLSTWKICNEMKRDFLYLNVGEVFRLMQCPMEMSFKTTIQNPSLASCCGKETFLFSSTDTRSLCTRS